jgi:hypothetical protein
MDRMSTDDTPGIRLSAEYHAFHSREVGRLRALASSITTKAVKVRVLQQAQEHARLIGLRDDHTRPEEARSEGK